MNRFRREYHEEIKNGIHYNDRIHKSSPSFFENDYNLTSTFMIIGIIGLIITLIVTVSVISSIFTGFINPEYGAIDYITNLIK